MNNWLIEMKKQQALDQELLKQINRELKHAPEGDLRLSHYRGKARFYQSKIPDVKDKYLGDEELALRAALAQKKYDLRAKEVLEQELKAMKQMEKKQLLTIQDVYDFLPKEVQELVEPHVLPDDEYIKRWLEEMRRGASGEDFKSRIELIFDQYYEKHDIPRVYEPALYLEGYGPARPDFAVLNVRTRKMYYHEHLGIMDAPDYRADNMRKLRSYHKSGYYEGINLIVTMESDGRMIDYKEMEQLILTYLR